MARDKGLGVTYWVTPMARAATEAPIAHPLQRRICAAKFCIPALSIHQLAEPLSTTGGGLLRMVGDAIAYLNRLPKHGETKSACPGCTNSLHTAVPPRRGLLHITAGLSSRRAR